MMKVFNCSEMHSVFYEENHEFSKRQLLHLNLYSQILVKCERIRAKCLCSILAQANRTTMQKKI